MAVCPNGHDSASEDFCDVCGMRIDGTRSNTGPSGTTGMPSYGSLPPAPGGSAPGGPGGPGPGQGGDPCPRCGTARSGQFCESCGFNFGTAQPAWAPTPPPPSGSQPLYPSPPPSQPPPMPPLPSQPTPPPPQSSSASAPPYSGPPSAPYSPPPPASSSWPPGPAHSAPPDSSGPLTRPPGPRPSPLDTWTAVVSADHDYYEIVRAAGSPDGGDLPFPAYCAERRFRLTGSQMQIGRRSVSRGLDPEIDLTGPPADPGISRLHAVLIAAPDGSWTVLDPGSANGTLLNGREIPTGSQVPLHDGDRINLGAWTAITVYRS
jgi:FHA domain